MEDSDDFAETTTQLVKLLKQDEIITQLKMEIVNIEFMKKDGTRRKMTCTLMPEMLPDQIDLEEHVQSKAYNPDILAVFDTDKDGWRSFRWDSLLSVNGVKFE